MAYTSTNAENVQLGTCSVKFGDTDLGLTKGGVEVAVATEVYAVTVDQFGTTQINEYITGRTVTVTVPMAETDLEKFHLILPGSTLVTDSTTSTKKKLMVPSGIGQSLLSIADELVCHPVALPETDLSQDFTVPKTSPKGEFTFAFRLNEERIYSTTFTGYADLTSNTLFIIGDPSATA